MTFTTRLSHVCRGSIALVGDASGSVDAITGDGLHLAFLQALALADAFEANDLAAYEAKHPAKSRAGPGGRRDFYCRSTAIRSYSAARLESCRKIRRCYSRLMAAHEAEPAVAELMGAGLVNKAGASSRRNANGAHRRPAKQSKPAYRKMLSGASHGRGRRARHFHFPLSCDAELPDAQAPARSPQPLILCRPV